MQLLSDVVPLGSVEQQYMKEMEEMTLLISLTHKSGNS